MEELNSFYYAMSLMETLYGVTMSEDEFEEVAIVAFDLIGNKRTRLYRYETCIDSKTKSVELPCNVYTIEAVTTNFEEWAHVTNDSPNGDYSSAYIENYIEDRKLFKHPLYASGKFVDYERVEDTLYFDKDYGKINILYKGLVLDDNGLPQITNREAEAIATYCAYASKFKEGLRTNNVNIINIANELKSRWNLKVDQARVAYHFSQNEWDQVLNARTSWCRKQHNRSFKFLN